MNDRSTPQYTAKKRLTGKKKLLTIIIIAAVGAFVLIGAIVALLESLDGTRNSGGEVDTVDPWLLEETKPEDFDIMEYEEYLMLDRNIYHDDKQTGIRVSVSEEEYSMYGEGFELLCRVIESVIAGDAGAYNGYMGDDSLKKEWFSQQQIYAIEISPYSTQNLTDKNGRAYTEYVLTVRYKIHENNGTYRNTVDSDEVRPQYFVVNNSGGEYRVMDILEKHYGK